MNTLKIFSLIFILVIAACGTKQSSVNSLEAMQEESDVLDLTHNSQNSLDWIGTYSGILPCADCEGIQTIITLNKDNTYKKTTAYLGKPNNSYEEIGTFSWRKDLNSIALNAQNGELTIYKVEENRLRMLDQEGLKVKGELTDYYLLQKAVSPIVNKYWKATEIMGRKVEVSDEMDREPYLIIRFNGEFSGGGGCNAIFGKFELQAENKITFSDIGTTLKACEFDNFDQQLAEVLNLTLQFIVTNEEQLQLFVDKDSPLAKFEVVYF